MPPSSSTAATPPTSSSVLEFDVLVVSVLWVRTVRVVVVSGWLLVSSLNELPGARSAPGAAGAAIPATAQASSRHASSATPWRAGARLRRHSIRRGYRHRARPRTRAEDPGPIGQLVE